MWPGLVLSGPAFRANVGRLPLNDSAANVNVTDLFTLLCEATETDCGGRVTSASKRVAARLLSPALGGAQFPAVPSIQEVIEYASSPEHMPVTGA